MREPTEDEIFMEMKKTEDKEIFSTYFIPTFLTKHSQQV